MFSTLPKTPQPLPLVAQPTEPSIFRLRHIHEEEDRAKKEAEQKGKKIEVEPITQASDQFMVQ